MPKAYRQSTQPAKQRLPGSARNTRKQKNRERVFLRLLFPRGPPPACSAYGPEGVFRGLKTWPAVAGALASGLTTKPPGGFVFMPAEKGAKKRNFCGAGLQIRGYVMPLAVTTGGVAIPNRKEP